MTEIVLLSPPDEVRAECCAGLQARAETGRGGTAKSVPFASRVCAGGPVTQVDLVEMLTHMAAIEDAMIARGLGDPALNVAWKLWGGDAGREWAEGFVMRQAPLVAAPDVLDEAPPVEQDPEAPDWILTLNRLADGEVELLARIHELMEAGVEFAVGRLRSKVVNSLARPSAALKAACGGLAMRDALLAAMADAPGPDGLRLVPAPILARVAPSIELDESLRQVFAQLSTRLRDLIVIHQEAVGQALRDGGVPDVLLIEAGHLWRADLDGALTAATDELMGIVAITARQAADLPQEGEIPTGRVPASLAFRLLSGAGGGDPGDGTRQDYVTMGGGEVLAAGVALGVTALRAIGRASLDGALHGAAVAGTLVFTEGPEFAIVTRTTWRWGGSARPFPSHKQLNGVSWDSEQQREQLCANPDRFPPVAVLHPGDHRGCSCSFTVQLVLKQTKAAKAKFVPNDPTAVGGQVGVTPPAPTPARPKTAAKPMTTVVPAKPPVVPRRQQPAPQMPLISSTASTGIKPAQQKQIEAMAAQLASLTAKTPAKVRLLDKMPHDDPRVLGLAQRGGDTVLLNNKKLTGATKPLKADGGFTVANGRKVTDLEYTLIHEWGHTTDVQTKVADELFDQLRKGQVAVPGRLKAQSFFPSKYAATNSAEMYAEAFTDWHIDSAAAHPVSAFYAKRFGWQTSNLAEFSAARR